jgi:group I intron endonuclease
MKTGIYKIVNKLNSKSYVGSSSNLNKRWYSHIFRLKKNTHHSSKLQNSFNKYGIENFLFELIEECPKELLLEREQYWIDTLNSYVNGYNSTPRAGNNGGLSKETIEKLKKIHTGKKMSEEARKKMSESRKGRKLSEETKEKLRKTSKGRKHTEEARKKMSESRKGAVVTEKVKKTLSNLYKGKSWEIVEGKRVWVI